MPGRVFEGRVETLLPQIETSSRTQPARIVLENPDGVLAPGMFAQITLEPTGGAEQPLDRKRVVSGKSVSVRVDIGGRRIHKKKKQNHLNINRLLKPSTHT